ncbi:MULTISPECIES: GMC family oxidoreductase [Pseudoxanthomonas]|uniref:Choline dehydrogenase-like flavoprotein n=1 Tax=Pseudoxanthomonas winnipegensis TaxID=2480810 RepID=A0AAW8G6Z2_9GAMM|nr:MULTISPECIES: GMC family oxidoreductase [Pseudoxanthomonas]MDQ1118067.1 choline dehydrogenase-like flavoprotein [Pseudoxanthomonas winnipegensis]MDQ1135036.1 choline dehydrogenase-like flavoprotein [Pseudoxanthomonas winnipegensis]MDR6138732.1 choline dehydrogenase-like flavoprotein [Pseudoxanthomonas sp. SORGH_AS_0997]
MADNHYDAIVVGSGISGGWAAKELTERGLKVLMLERGRNIEHIKDYVNAGKEAWDYPHHDTPTQQMKADHPVLKRDYPLSESTYGMWADEKDCPYTETKRFDWFRGYHVGGRSLMWGRQSYRLSDIDFGANAKEGIAVDWPIRYADIAPWYDHVERFAGIAGTTEGLDVLPDGQFLPPIPLNIVEQDVAARLKKAFGGTRHMIHSRTANITQPKPEQGRVNCQYRNKCILGCPFGAYFSTQSATLPAAMATGNLTLRPFSIVKEVLYDKDRKRAKGVEIIDAETGQTYVYTAKVVFLNASAFNSTWLLMNSATDVWDGGLGSSSGELGHNVMDHHFRVGASGRVDGYEDKYYYGRRPCGFYIPRFRNLGEERRDYVRGFGYQGGASRTGWSRDIAELNIGADLKQALTVPGEWRIGMTAFGEILPYHDNTISLNRNVKDKWGLPVLAMDVSLRENEHAMRKDMGADAAEMLEAAGVKDVEVYESDYAPGMGIHEMGTARMGRDRKTSVLNMHNQVWDAPNVFVTDGACMTSAACVNPSLTYMALTARAADHAVRELKAGNL